MLGKVECEMPNPEISNHSTDVLPESNLRDSSSNAAYAKLLDEAQSSYTTVDKTRTLEQALQHLNFDNSIYNSVATKADQLPTVIQVGEKRVELPEGITDYQLKDGLPSYTKNGVTVDLNDKGEAKAYHSNGFSFEHHEDNDTWYYHEDKGGKFVQIDIPTLNEDGSVSTKEHGGFNNGREHKLDADGQSSQSLGSAKLGRIADQINLDNLGEAIKERSVSDAFSWAKENVGAFTGLGTGALLLDGLTGTNTYGTANALVKGIGETLVDGTVNGTVYLAGLAQGGLEKIPGAPDLKQIDQVIPKLDLFQGYSEAANSGSEKIAYRIGQVGGFVMPVVGQVSGALRLSKSAVSLVKEGKVISTISDNSSKLLSIFRTKNGGEGPKLPELIKPNQVPKLVLETGSKPFANPSFDNLY